MNSYFDGKMLKIFTFDMHTAFASNFESDEYILNTVKG